MHWSDQLYCALLPMGIHNQESDLDHLYKALGELGIWEQNPQSQQAKRSCFSKEEMPKRSLNTTTY